MDSLLRRLNDAGLYVQAYADDLVILCRGARNNLQGPMARALRMVDDWCRSAGLRINPKKAQLMLFSNKRNLDTKPAITLAGTTLEYHQTVKYLGIHVDRKLSWREHLACRIKKAMNALWTCRRVAGGTWGLNPRVLHWLYCTTVRPLITYGAIVWWPCVEKNSACSQLDKVQRMACLLITGAMRTTPSRALEVMLDLMPLELCVKMEATRAAYRLRVGQQLQACSYGHSRIWGWATDRCLPLLMPK